MTQALPGGLVAIQSDRVEELVDRLVLEMARERERRTDSPTERPFVDHCVVVPTRNLATYLRFEIAARLGVAAGVEFVTAERFLEDLLPVDEDGQPAVRLLDAIAVTRQILSLLDSPFFGDCPELEPVRRFVIPAGDSAPEVVEQRKFQFAFRLARLFEEYGYSRQNLLHHWRRERSGLKQEYSHQATQAHFEIEAWQSTIFRRLFGPQGKARMPSDGDGRPWMLLPQAIHHYLSDDDGALRWPTMVHVFGHSYFPRFFRRLFSTRTYADDSTILLYVMSPCLEYWSRGVAGDRDEDPVFDLLTDDSPLEGDEYPLALSVWGRAGRDYQRMIDDVAYDRHDISLVDRRPRITLLQHFQAMIRHMETARSVFDERAFPEDEKSLNLWSCASVQRECEAIASEIRELVTTHDDLRFNDIAVVVQPGERAVYQTHLEAAFAQSGGIPSNVIDVEAAESSPFLEASKLLLELPLGQFRRRELLALLVHPNLVANYPEADEDAWLQWCDAVNIFQGVGEHDLESTYLSEDRFTWSQGIRRLVLGAFMSQPDPESPNAVTVGDQRYLPYETQHQDLETVATLTALADDLITTARSDGEDKRPLGKWMEYFADRVTKHLKARDRAQRRTKMQFLGELGRIAESDACPDEDIGYRTAFDFAMASMSKLEKTRGHYLADGVVVSAFRPMRPIPFEVVFVAGLGEGKFPAPNPPDMLDLRRVKSEEHDVNPRYQDQYMFLETLITTRSRLYLSWVGRHAITGESVEPASVVHQLREMILEMAPDDGQKASEIRRRLERRVAFREHPLRRYDERYFPGLFDDDASPEVIDARGPDAIPPGPPQAVDGGEPHRERRWPNHHRQARHEARAKAVRKRLESALPQGYRPTMQQLQEVMDDGAFASLAELLQWTRPTSTNPVEYDRTVVLQLHHVRRFLQSPLQGAARVVLGLYDEDDDDVLDVDHEPFEADFLTRLRLVRRVLNAASRSGELSAEHLASTFDEMARAAELSGELPAGMFFDAEREKCLRMLDTYAEGLAEEVDAGGGVRRIRFGNVSRRQHVDQRFEPIEFDVEVAGQSVAVELHGSVEVWGHEHRSVVVAAGRKAKAKYGIQGGVEQLALCAAGTKYCGETAVVTNRGDVKTLGVSIGDQTKARGYLEDVVGELLTGVHDYFLPVEFVEDLVRGDVDDYRRAARKKKQPRYGRDKASVSTAYGPVRRWQDAEPPPRPNAERIIDRRYRPFMPFLEHE